MDEREREGRGIGRESLFDNFLIFNLVLKSIFADELVEGARTKVISSYFPFLFLFRFPPHLFPSPSLSIINYLTSYLLLSPSQTPSIDTFQASLSSISEVSLQKKLRQFSLLLRPLLTENSQEGQYVSAKLFVQYVRKYAHSLSCMHACTQYSSTLMLSHTHARKHIRTHLLSFVCSAIPMLPRWWTSKRQKASLPSK